MLRLKYFGMVAETINKTEETFLFIKTLEGLTVELEKKYPQLKSLNYKFAVNQTMAEEAVLKENDEIALLPPFAGG